MARRYVLTGAPGSGKTVVGLALRARGYLVVAEAATDVIAIQQEQGVDEPWLRDDFIDEIVTLQRHRQVQALPGTGQAQIYDRSPLCTVALARYLQLPVTALLAQEVARVIEEQVYEPDVFVVRPLGFVARTAARRITYEDSLAFEAVHEAVYREHGFHLIDVPADAIEKRAATIDSYIRSKRGQPQTPGMS